MTTWHSSRRPVVQQYHKALLTVVDLNKHLVHILVIHEDFELQGFGSLPFAIPRGGVHEVSSER